MTRNDTPLLTVVEQRAIDRLIATLDTYMAAQRALHNITPEDDEAAGLDLGGVGSRKLAEAV